MSELGVLEGLLKNPVITVHKFVHNRSRWRYRFEDVEEDIKRLIHKCVTKYVSSSNVSLHREDLESECWAKFTSIVSNVYVMDKLETRSKFFGYVSVAFKNMLSGLLYSQEYTEKRSGIKNSGDTRRHQKRDLEARIDIDDGIEIPVYDSNYTTTIESLLKFLTPVQKLVLANLINPGEEALFYASMEAKGGISEVNVEVTDVHLAKAIGLDIRKYKEEVREIKNKARNIGRITDRYEYVSSLASRVGVKIPTSVDLSVINKLLVSL